MEQTLTKKLSYWGIIKESIRRIIFHWKPLLSLSLLTILMVGVVWVLSICAYFLITGASLSSVIREITASIVLYGAFSFSVVPEGATQISLFVLVFLISTFAGLYVFSRFLISSIKLLSTSEKVTVNSAYAMGKEGVFKIVKLLIVIGCIMSFTAMFFVIPGLYYGLALSLTLFYAVLEHKGIKESMYLSLQNTYGNKFKIFVLVLVGMILPFLITIAGTIISFATSTFIERIFFASTSGFMSAVLPMVMFAVVMFISSIVPYLYICSILSVVYSESKHNPNTERVVRWWPILVISILGFLIYVFMLVVIPFLTGGAVDRAKKSAEKAYQMQKNMEQQLQVEEKGDQQMTPYEEQLQVLLDKDIVTSTPGNKGDGEAIGMGMNFKYPYDWMNIGAHEKTKQFAQFVRVSQMYGTSSKVDLYNGGVAFEYKYNPVTSDLMTGYEFLKQNATAKMEKEKQEGLIESYSITAYPGKKEVGVLESRWKQVSKRDNKTEVTVREKYYYWFVGPHKYTIQAVDDSKDFYDTNKAARLMIDTMKFDDLILNYRK